MVKPLYFSINITLPALEGEFQNLGDFLSEIVLTCPFNGWNIIFYFGELFWIIAWLYIICFQDVKHQ